MWNITKEVINLECNLLAFISILSIRGPAFSAKVGISKHVRVLRKIRGLLKVPAEFCSEFNPVLLSQPNTCLVRRVCELKSVLQTNTDMKILAGAYSPQPHY